MDVTPEMLDSVFNPSKSENVHKQRHVNGFCRDALSKSSDCSSKQTIKQKLTSFVRSEGSLEGARLPQGYFCSSFI